LFYKVFVEPGQGRAGQTGGQGMCAVGGQRLAKRTWTMEHKYCNQTALPNPAVNLTCNGSRLMPGGVRFAHCTPPFTSRLPSQAGYC
jgi:hypothetical protein